jgi:N-acetylmuramoyl-L-alanine amidase
MNQRLIIGALLLLLVGIGFKTAPLQAAASRNRGQSVPGRAAAIKDIRRTVLPDAVRLIIELDGEVPFHQERITDPDRVFVDLTNARPTPALAERTIRYELDADIVRQVRLGRHPNNTTRVVLDAANVSSYSVYPLYGPFRIVIDCVRAAGVMTAAPTSSVAPPILPAPVAAVHAEERSVPPAPAPPPPRPLRGKRLPTAVTVPVGVTHSKGADLIAKALSSEKAVASEKVPAGERAAPSTAAASHAKPTPMPVDDSEDERMPEPAVAAVNVAPPPVVPPAKNTNGGFSISRQLGLGVSRIVIDPGHGGHDPGAKGKGVNEAELVLDVALRVEKLLAKVPGVEVILTRRTDDFIALQERTAIANREGADLFLSIHANASPTAQARGIETYFLNFANNLSAAAVAARENAASGQTMGALPDLVKTIALNNKLDESRDFATQVQTAMMDKLRSSNKTIKDLGVKQAPFVVLIGAAMPSVLAEISFVTNPQEARLLKGNAYRQRIADALFNAIRKYQTSLKNGTAVAQQQ